MTTFFKITVCTRFLSVNTSFIMCLYLQWIAEKLDFLANYYINRVSSSQDFIPLKCFYAVFQQIANRYDLGLSNEPLFIIIGQGAAKLRPFKVGSSKKIRPSTTLNPNLLSKREASKAILLDLQL